MKVNKSGISYFSLDVNLDSKMELIEAEFGVVGFGIVVHLLQEIYGKAGYYIEWNSEVALLFSRKIGEGAGVVSQVIEAFDKLGSVDRDAILNALEAQKASDQWQKERGRFIPAPARWLKAKCWEDELPEAEAAKGRRKTTFSAEEQERLNKILEKVKGEQ